MSSLARRHHIFMREPW